MADINFMRKNEFAPKWYATGDPTATAAVAAKTEATNTVSAAPKPGVDVGGFNPDYQSLILSDPNYLAWANAHPGVVADAASQRKAAMRAFAMQYGGLPPGFQDTYGDLSSEDLAAAQANPYSDMAQLNTQYQNNLGNLRKGLAARGQLHSGDLGYGQGALDQQLGKSQYDLAQQFGTNFQGALGSYLDAMHNDEIAREGAIGQAYQDVISNPAYQPGPSTSAQAELIPTWQQDYGTPVYKTGDGRYYTLGPGGVPVIYAQ